MGRPSIHRVYNETYQSEAENYKNHLLILGYNTDTCQARYLYLKAFFSWLEQQQHQQLQYITPMVITKYQ
jgi:integrase/recombinase XerD